MISRQHFQEKILAGFEKNLRYMNVEGKYSEKSKSRMTICFTYFLSKTFFSDAFPFNSFPAKVCLVYHLLMKFGRLYCSNMDPDQAATLVAL